MRTLLATTLLTLLLSPPLVARAEEGAKPPPVPDLRVPPPDLDFVLLDEKAAERPKDAALEGAVARRRGFLQAHQAAGLATWALMGATVVYGRLNYRDMYFGEGTGKYRDTHNRLAYTTTAAFAFTGLLAALAPEPYPKKLRFDTATLHKTSMALATLGLATQVVLGRGITRGLGNLDTRDLATAHQAVGIGTFAAMSVGAITLVF